MTDTAGRLRSTGGKIALAVGLVLGVGLIGALVLVFWSSPSCGCAIPEDDEEAIETAQQYVAVVAEDPQAMLADGAAAPTAEQAEQLSLLDQAGTHWVVHLTQRPDGGGGDTPAERLLIGVAPSGEVGAVVVHTESDYLQGTVDPAVEARDTEPVIARTGEYPIFGELNVGMSAEVRGSLAVVSLTDGPLDLSVTGSGGAWAYVGTEPLQDEQYRYLRGGQRSSDGLWWFAAAWFSPSDPVTEDT